MFWNHSYSREINCMILVCRLGQSVIPSPLGPDWLYCLWNIRIWLSHRPPPIQNNRWLRRKMPHSGIDPFFGSVVDSDTPQDSLSLSPERVNSDTLVRFPSPLARWIDLSFHRNASSTPEPSAWTAPTSWPLILNHSWSYCPSFAGMQRIDPVASLPRSFGKSGPRSSVPEIRRILPCRLSPSTAAQPLFGSPLLSAVCLVLWIPHIPFSDVQWSRVRSFQEGPLALSSSGFWSSVSWWWDPDKIRRFWHIDSLCWHRPEDCSFSPPVHFFIIT